MSLFDQVRAAFTGANRQGTVSASRQERRAGGTAGRPIDCGNPPCTGH